MQPAYILAAFNLADPLSWSHVLEAEFAAIHGAPPLAPDASLDPDERLRLLHQAIHEHPASALCLSGGGIRSGTFALGVLQGLAHLGILGAFDYLSTVSGGGYTGGWFTAWLHRQGPPGRDRILRALDPAQASAETGAIDAAPIGYLRRMCRYLAPIGGELSADFWALLATLGRNLILNWLVILPLVAAALLVPRLFYTLTERFETGFQSYSGLECLAASRPSMLFLAIAVVGFALAVGYLAAVFSGIGNRWSQERFLAWFLVPLIAGAIGGTLFWSAFPCDLSLSWTIGLSAALPAAGWIGLGIFARNGSRQPDAAVKPHSRTDLRTVLAAAVAGSILGLGMYWFATFEFGFGVGEGPRRFYAVAAVPIVLALVLVAITLFVGLAGEELDDEELEWWSRCGAWIGIATTAWLAAGVLVIYLADAMESAFAMFERAWHLPPRSSVAAVSALLPLVSSLAGLAARSTGATARPSSVRVAVQRLTLPLIVVALLTAIAWAGLRGAETIEYHRDADHNRCVPAVRTGECHTPGGGLGEVMILGVSLLAFGLLMNCCVPANRFSLHGMYRQRLVRTFLGASRANREPSPFTGFDAADDLRVHDLADVRPLHVMNATLNAVSSTKVSAHEKQAESFTFSPLHVGNREVGYRPAAEYGSDGGAPGSGLSLGMALAVSGAAASPAMGMYSSKSLAFLLTVANARLGLWFGNPNDATSWQNSEPPLGVRPILRELLDLTTDQSPYVYLSDGGHYENLGLWEMVARRCRFIVVSDGGCDPDYSFTDLSNAVRRIRLDLGIPIEFPPLDITKAGQGDGNPHLAIGLVRYSVIDGPEVPDGTILYLKATLSGDEPVDVWNFARTDHTFPHDSTTDQFFNEARFESYRALGFHTVLSAAAGFQRGQGMEGLCAAARTALDQASSFNSSRAATRSGVPNPSPNCP